MAIVYKLMTIFSLPSFCQVYFSSKMFQCAIRRFVSRPGHHFTSSQHDYLCWQNLDVGGWHSSKVHTWKKETQVDQIKKLKACERCFILKLNVATIVSWLSSSDFTTTEALTLNFSNSPARRTPIHAVPFILTHSSIFSLIFTLKFLFFLPFSLYPPCTHLVTSCFISFFLNYFSNVLSGSRVLRKSARNLFSFSKRFSNIPQDKI